MFAYDIGMNKEKKLISEEKFIDNRRGIIVSIIIKLKLYLNVTIFFL